MCHQVWAGKTGSPIVWQDLEIWLPVLSSLQSSDLSGKFVAFPTILYTGKLDFKFSRGEGFVHCSRYAFGIGSSPFDCKFWYAFNYFLSVILFPTFLCVSDVGSPLPQFTLPHHKKWLLSIYLFIFYTWENQSWERVNILYNIFSTCSQSEAEPEMDSGAVVL